MVLASRRLVAALSLAIVALSIGLGVVYYKYNERSGRIARLALLSADGELIYLRDLPDTLRLIRADLEKYNCSPMLLRQVEPGKAMFGYYVLRIYSIHVRHLEDSLVIAYEASGHRMPPSLSLALDKIGDYLMRVSQEYYFSMIGHEDFSCKKLPSNDVLRDLGEVFDEMHKEIQLVIQGKRVFRGLSDRLVDDIVRVGQVLESIG